jgi:DNA-binding HxlR family transcriptional regulator
MTPRNTHLPEDCRAISDILSRVGDKWSVLVVTRLGGGPMRFNVLRRSIGGISQRMLTLTLRGLERDGLVTRTVFPSVPPRVDYALTPLGRDLLNPVSALGDWATRNQGKIARAREKFDGVLHENPAPRSGPQDAPTAGLSAPSAPPRSSRWKARPSA